MKVSVVPSVNCLECGKPSARDKRVSREYCSDTCYTERKKRLRKEKSPPQCAICSCAFVRRGNRQKFCDGCGSGRAKQYAAAYAELNSELILAKRRDYMSRFRREKPEIAAARDKAWWDANKTTRNVKRRTPEYRANAAERLRRRVKQEPRLAVHNRMSSAVYQAIRGAKAGRKWERLVGYTLADLTAHLERQFLRGMSWDNVGDWHIDHIVPKSSFEYETAEDPGFIAAWSLTNLRPLWAAANQSKHAKRTHLI